MNFGQIWWEIGGNLAVLDFGQAQAKHAVQHLFMPRLGQTLSLSWKSRIDSYFPRPVGRPSHQRGKEGVVLPFVTWAGTGQTCSSTFVHASSWPNTVLVTVKQNFCLFLTPPMYGGAASVASKKPVHVPSRKNLCPCNAAGRLAFAYAVQVNKHSRVGPFSEKLVRLLNFHA